MNPIMGKLGNSVAQFLMPTATKVGASDAMTGAAVPTAFAALLSNVAGGPKVVGLASDQPKSIAMPAASSSEVANNDLLVAELPLGAISSDALSEPAPVKGAPIPEAVIPSKDAPTLDTAAAVPMVTEVGFEEVPSASSQPVSLPVKPSIEQRRSTISGATVSRVNPRSKDDLEPEVAKAALPSDENPADTDVVSAVYPQPVDPMGDLNAVAMAVEAVPIRAGASAPTTKASADTGARLAARTSSGPAKNQEPVTLNAANGNTGSDPAPRLAPKELPPEFAAILAASTKVKSKAAGDKPEQAAPKITASQGDIPVFAKAVLGKDATLPPPAAVDHPRAKTSEAVAGEASTSPTSANAQPVTAPVSPQAPSMPGGPIADLSASLGQQVIDMGAGGQWIEGLAHEIAALSKGEGHGSFRLSPEHLGPMRVDIRPGDQGANVTLTVETKAAETMLMQDRNILKADAQLAAVKIGDVTVERVAHVHEPARADTATGQGTGQGSGQGQSQTSSQTASQGNGGQGSNQSALAQGQGQSQQNGNHAGNRKVSSDAAVSSQAEPRDAGDRDMPNASRRARYA